MSLPDWIDVVTMPGGLTPVRGEKLRHWELCETWRVWWSDGPPTIVKRGAGGEATEADAYERLLIPYAIAAPHLLAVARGDGVAVLVLADVGAHTLEQRPSADGFRAAARMLAGMRHAAAGRLGTASEFRLDDHKIMDLWVRVTRGLVARRPDLGSALSGADHWLPSHLARLRDTVSETIVHGDFESKNLMLTPDGVMAIDWSAARVSPYLGDLYQLIRDAARTGGLVDDLPMVYAKAMADYGTPVTDLDWQISLGGMIWTLRALRWIVEEGIGEAPFTAGWLDGLVGEARALMDRLAP